MITFGELLVGVALIIGALTGVAAFFGSFMNMSFMLSGSASSHPVLFFLAIESYTALPYTERPRPERPVPTGPSSGPRGPVRSRPEGTDGRRICAWVGPTMGP